MINSEVNFEKDRWKTIIIGVGQAGMAAGYYLQKTGEDFLIIDSAKRVGDSWRQRWDTLRLFLRLNMMDCPVFHIRPREIPSLPRMKLQTILKNMLPGLIYPFGWNEKVIRLNRDHPVLKLPHQKGCSKLTTSLWPQEQIHVPKSRNLQETWIGTFFRFILRNIAIPIRCLRETSL